MSYKCFTIMQMMRNAVNGYVNTIKVKENVKQNVIRIEAFSRSVNIFISKPFKGFEIME